MRKIGKSSWWVVFLSVLSLFFCVAVWGFGWVEFKVDWTPGRRGFRSNGELTSIEYLDLFSANTVKGQACYSFAFCENSWTLVSRLHRSHLTAFQIAGLETLLVVVCLVSGLCAIVNLYFLATGGKKGWVGFATILFFLGRGALYLAVPIVWAGIMVCLALGINNPFGIYKIFKEYMYHPPETATMPDGLTKIFTDAMYHYPATDTMPDWSRCVPKFTPWTCTLASGRGTYPQGEDIADWSFGSILPVGPLLLMAALLMTAAATYMRIKPVVAAAGPPPIEMDRTERGD
jgi:hypothetical protein